MFKRLSVLLLITLSVTVLAQPNSCPVAISQVFDELNENCSNLERNTICYGHNRINATFFEEVPDGYFSLPADRVPSYDIDELTTYPLNEEQDEFGVALLKIQADLPNSLPGQALTIVMMGDASLANAVMPEDAFEPAGPIMVTATQDTALRSEPSEFNNSRIDIPAQAVLAADAISEDGLWLRVIFEETAGWILREFTDLADTVPDLPVLNDEIFTPMQAFYLQTRPGQSLCDEVPNSSIILRVPPGQVVNVEINGAPITVGNITGTEEALVVVNTPTEGQMDITVMQGEAVLQGDEAAGEEDVIIEEGQRSSTCLVPTEEGGFGEKEGCGWSEPINLKAEDLSDPACVSNQLPLGFKQFPFDCDVQNQMAFAVGAIDLVFPAPPPIDLVTPPTPTPTPQPAPQFPVNPVPPPIVVVIPVVPPAVNQNPGSTGDPNDNWCYPGGVWGDGRCDDPDPAISNWHWTCGWYLVRLQDGRFDSEGVPETCRPVQQDPVQPGSSNFTATWSCVEVSPGSADISIIYSGVPTGTSSITITYVRDEDSSVASFVQAVPPNSGTFFTSGENAVGGGGPDFHAGMISAGGSSTDITPGNLTCT